MRVSVCFKIFAISQCMVILISLMANYKYIIQAYKTQLHTHVSDLDYRSKHKDTAYKTNSKYNPETVTLETRTSFIEQAEEIHIAGSTKELSEFKFHKRPYKTNIHSDKISHNLTNEVFFFETRKPVTEVNCRSILQGDVTEIKKAILKSKIYHKLTISPQTYIGITNNCKLFKFRRGYIINSLTECEKKFPIAFSLLMYKDVEQTERLLRAIYRPQNIYCIHVDLKTSDVVYEAVRSIANCFENVFTTSKRINVTWGNFTVLEPDLLCMQELWNRNKTWKYFINLTGQEFPLRTNYELVKIISAFNGSNNVDVVKGDYKFILRLNGVGESPHGIVPKKGAVHVVVSRAFVEYVLNDQRAQDFLKWAKLTQHPDETFFSSLHSNPTLHVPGSNKDGELFQYARFPRQSMLEGHWFARFKNWGQYVCRGKFVRNVCIFGTGDLPFLSSRFELFANKFHIDYHPFALDCMEEFHFNHTRDEYFANLKLSKKRYSNGR